MKSISIRLNEELRIVSCRGSDTGAVLGHHLADLVHRDDRFRVIAFIDRTRTARRVSCCDHVLIDLAGYGPWTLRGLTLAGSRNVLVFATRNRNRSLLHPAEGSNTRIVATSGGRRP